MMLGLNTSSLPLRASASTGLDLVRGLDGVRRSPDVFIIRVSQPRQ